MLNLPSSLLDKEGKDRRPPLPILALKHSTLTSTPCKVNHVDQVRTLSPVKCTGNKRGKGKQFTIYRVFSLDFTAAVIVCRNNETTATSLHTAGTNAVRAKVKVGKTELSYRNDVIIVFFFEASSNKDNAKFAFAS